MQLSPSIFKAYDIRGIVPSTLDESVAERLGRAFGAAALAQGERCVAVGRDGRLSGPALAGALMRGLVAAGVARVVIACEDPSTFAAGQGAERLRGAGVAVELGLLSDEAQGLYSGYRPAQG